MENYVLFYHFDSKEAMGNFKKEIVKAFPLNMEESTEPVTYFAFAARELPAIQDKVNTIIDIMSVGDEDFVALYYMKEEDPDVIKRLMLLGPSGYIENELEKRNLVPKVHVQTLTALLKYDFIKHQTTANGNII